jgi:formylglycine-generating enzyme required for sulfatase activity
MADGGYSDQSLWDRQGWAWLRGNFNSVIADRSLRVTLSQRQTNDRQKPWQWHEQLIHGSRPVNGVTWFESRAYARWLNIKIKNELNLNGLNSYRVCLPTEKHWERAARETGSGTTHTDRWVTGTHNSEIYKYANVDTRVGLSVVGCYAPNPLGLLDLTGNLWEWQDNVYNAERDSPIEPTPEHFELNSEVSLGDPFYFPLRGGAWFGPEIAQVSTRKKSLPDSWDFTIGFRVMLSLAN